MKFLFVFFLAAAAFSQELATEFGKEEKVGILEPFIIRQDRTVSFGLNMGVTSAIIEREEREQTFTHFFAGPAINIHAGHVLAIFSLNAAKGYRGESGFAPMAEIRYEAGKYAAELTALALFAGELRYTYIPFGAYREVIRHVAFGGHGETFRGKFDGGPALQFRFGHIEPFVACHLRSRTALGGLNVRFGKQEHE